MGPKFYPYSTFNGKDKIQTNQQERALLVVCVERCNIKFIIKIKYKTFEMSSIKAADTKTSDFAKQPRFHRQ